MNNDEFAFFNQQLAAMLREGIPLEGALKQLCAGLQAGPLRSEMEKLEAELARGTPLKDALGRRALPEFYVRMLEIGARSNDLPGVLTLLADHYHGANALWTRLKGLMVYPLIVIVVSLGLTLVLSLTFGKFTSQFLASSTFLSSPGLPLFAMWIPPLLLSLAAVAGLAAFYVPAWRGRLRWRLPAFREASLAQFASAMALMLRNGTTLADALVLAESMETTTPAGAALRQWRSLVEKGQGKPGQWTGTAPFPPLFVWLVQKGGEDVATAFQRAAELYQARASYRIELALYGALPVSVLLLGQMVIWQAAPMLRTLIWMMNMLGAIGD